MKQAIRTAKPRTLASLVFIVFYSTLHGREAAVGDSRPQAQREPAWQSGMIVENSPNPSGPHSAAGPVKEPLPPPGLSKKLAREIPAIVVALSGSRRRRMRLNSRGA